jgi:O-methyltransferase
MQESEIKLIYLDLLKKALSRSIFDDCFSLPPKNTKTLLKALRWYMYIIIRLPLTKIGLEVVSKRGRIGETMMGMGALNNLQSCISEIITENVPGDFCETGVWRGGGCILMAAMSKIYGEGYRKIWVCDSFEGLPKPNAQLYPSDAGDELWKQELGVSVEQVKENFKKYSLLDDNIVFLKGFFSDTMPVAPIEKLSVLRLDGDMYESTIVVLRNLYSKLSVGGYVIFDDYGMIEGCNDAVNDFRKEESITDPLQIIGYINGNPLGAYWKKTQ